VYKNILIPTDGSDLSLKAIKAGVKLAQSLGAKVTGYYAMATLQPSLFGDGDLIDKATVAQLDQLARATGKKFLDEISKAAAAAGVEYAVFIDKPPAAHEGIIDAAKKKKCDAIFMSSRGRSEIRKLLLGSVTLKVLTYSKVPVIVFR
jgi:nucleotide-binding universal stress UspA family protein